MTKAPSLDLVMTQRLTYRYLRWVMVAALVALFLSVVIQSVQTCWLGSVSAYYYTPARTVFVGSLIAFGAALIAYQGRAREEDIALNFSGYMAIVVAMVPTREDDLCQATGRDPMTGFEQSDQAIADAVFNNIWALIGTTVAAVAVKSLLRLRRGKNRAEGEPRSQQRPWSALAVVTSIVCAGVLTVELIGFLTQPDWFIDAAHGTAAVTMVFGLVGVMFFNALRVKHDASTRLHYPLWYKALAASLIVLVVAVLLVRNPWVILILELVVFAVFVAYWILQSIELWGPDDEVQPATAADQQEPAVPDESPAGAERQPEVVASRD